MKRLEDFSYGVRLRRDILSIAEWRGKGPEMPTLAEVTYTVDAPNRKLYNFVKFKHIRKSLSLNMYSLWGGESLHSSDRQSK